MAENLPDDEYETSATMIVRVKNKRTRETEENILVDGPITTLFVCSQKKTEEGRHVTLHVLVGDKEKR